VLRTSPAIRHVLLLTALLAPIARAQSEPPTTEEAVPNVAELEEQFDQEEGKAFADFVASAQKAIPTPIEQLMRFDVVNGSLVASLVPPALPGDRLYAITDSPPTAFKLSIAPPEQFQSPMTMFQGHLGRFDATARRVLTVEVLPAPGTINVTTTVQTPISITSIQYIEQSEAAMGNNVGARLYVTVNSEIEATSTTDEGLKLVGTNFVDLVSHHHDEAVATLGEGLTALRAMHVLAGLSANEATAIFAADRPIAADTQHMLDAIIAEVREGGSESVAAARPKLRKLGTSAVMALARADRAGWSADDAVNIDALTAGLLPFSMEHAGALLNSRARLIDLLYSPDVATRREAAIRLERLSHQRIAIDPAVDPYTIAEKIEALRSTLASATTRPAH
jgi:hypothetical protein